MADSKEPFRPEDKDNWKPEDNSDDSSQEDAAPKRKQPPGNVVSLSRISIVIKTLDYERSSIRAMLDWLHPYTCEFRLLNHFFACCFRFFAGNY